MKTHLGAVALECLLDLGVTVGYALIAALAIVAIVASDNGTMSVVHTALYALLLPGGALALIGVEILLRVVKDIASIRRDGRCREAPAKASA